MKKIFKIGIVFLLAGLILMGCSSSTETSEENNISEGTTQNSNTDEENADDNDEQDSDSENTEDDSWNRIEEAGVMTVATEGTYAPVTYMDESGELTGFDVELIREIGDYLGIDVEFVPMTADSLLPSVRNNQVDLAANNIQITPERLEEFEMTQPYKYSFSSVAIRSENDPLFDSALDLEGHEFAVGSMTGIYANFAEAVGAEPILYESGPDAILRDVINENVMGYLNDYYVLRHILEEYGAEGIIIDEDVKYNSTAAGFMVADGAVSFKEKINEAIDALAEDGTIKRLSEEFYGTDATNPDESGEIIELEDVAG